MPYVRKLPSGRWQATVRHPSGRRLTKTDLLRRVVVEWGRDQEAAFSRGTWLDPSAAQATVREWHARWSSARIVATSTAGLNDVQWRTRVEPKWGGWPLAAVTRLDFGAWVKRMLADGVGVPSVRASAQLFGALMQAAVDEGILARNPCRGAALPPAVIRAPEWFTHGEADAVLSVLEGADRALVDLGMSVGLRWGELTGLHGEDVDWLRGQASIWRVLTRSGMREHPKSTRSRRIVGMPPEVVEAMSALMAGRDRTAPIFTGDQGGLLDYHNWRRRVWTPALAAAGVRYRRIHVMRHTAATWLVQDGVDLSRVQVLLGHEDYRTTLRYAHHAPGSDDVLQAVWARRRNARDAQATHGESGGSSTGCPSGGGNAR